ncbi:MAG: hypothetical protein ACRD52_00810, partial [Candidatus Acidiferrales bacterium]
LLRMLDEIYDLPGFGPHETTIKTIHAVADRIVSLLPETVAPTAADTPTQPECCMPNESAIDGFCWYTEISGEYRRCLHFCGRATNHGETGMKIIVGHPSKEEEAEHARVIEASKRALIASARKAKAN